LAGVLAISSNALLTLVWARLRFGGPALGGLLDTAWRVVAISAAGGLLGRQVTTGVEGSWGALLDLLGGGLVYAVVVGGGIVVIGDESTRQLVARTWRRVRRSGGRGSAEAGSSITIE